MYTENLHKYGIWKKMYKGTAYVYKKSVPADLRKENKISSLILSVYNTVRWRAGRRTPELQQYEISLTLSLQTEIKLYGNLLGFSITASFFHFPQILNNHLQK